MKTTITKFYEEFSRLNAEGMVECYHSDISFCDPAFGILKGSRAGNMWRMLCESQKGKDFKIEVSGIQSDGETGSAHWEAHYTFSKTGRKIHNIINASFLFKDGKIIKHTDSFNLYRWSGQALGLQGYLLGWTPFFHKKLNAQTGRLLDGFEKKNMVVH